VRASAGGCIIRARFLGKIKEAYLRNPSLANLLLDAEFKSKMEQAQPGWRIVVSTAQQQGLPVLAMSSSLGYFDMYRTASLPLNLTQAQRDFFGSHTYERVISQSQVPFILSGKSYWRNRRAFSSWLSAGAGSYTIKSRAGPPSWPRGAQPEEVTW